MSPTLGCSIEISRDIYKVYPGWYPGWYRLMFIQIEPVSANIVFNSINGIIINIVDYNDS